MNLRFFVLAVCQFLLITLILVDGRQTEEAAESGGSGPQNNTLSATLTKVSYPKKVISQKKRPTKASAVVTPTGKTRKPADVTSAFKDFPEDDLEFIKELDKQFKLHGDKIKFKVENENVTNPKNTKRTIEGELGYGYQHNGYEYARPKFEFYPYSQQDIPSDAPGYYTSYDKTTVSIQPSYSYELKPQAYAPQPEEQPQLDLPHAHVADEQQQHAAPEQQQHYDEPVIVLRIPGPAKYASHLQALLQQYLQIRATQYLHLLEEAELRKNQQHVEAEVSQQHYEQPQEAHVDYEQPPAYEQPAAFEQPPAYEQAPQSQHVEEPGYQQEVAYAHQTAPTPQPVHYPDIDDVYQGYKGRHSIHQQQQELQQQELQQHALQQQHVQAQQAAYYSEAQAYHAAHAQPQQHQQLDLQQYYYMGEQANAHNAYQQLYLVDMTPNDAYQQHEQQPAPIYVQEEETAQTSLQGNEHEHHDHTQSHISENNPRNTHTKVIFTQHNEQQHGADYVPMYELPSISPYEHHHQQQQQQQQQHYQTQEVATQLDYGQQATAPLHADASQHDTVSITQRPHNYHAHGIKSPARARRGRKRGAAASSTTAVPQNTVTAAASDAAVSVSVTHNEQKTEQQLQKIRAYVRDNLGAKMGTALEFKTTQVVDG